ncbi:hypothetical protein F4808DRAFT_124138 [Astrocystis sublimbata]|nr:hypothetical protein F4808DRAFT_124138 [Astrocystis sublimbata]
MSSLDFSSLSPHELQKILDSSALQPPPGVIPNFNNPENGNTVALVGLLLSLILSSIFLFVRVYVVFYRMKQPSLGDYLMLAGYSFFLVVCSGSLFRLSQAGLFIHQWNIRGRDIETYLKIVIIGLEFWFAGVLVVKASILAEWLRLFAPGRGRTTFATSCKVLLTANVLFYSAIIFTLNFSCRPFRKLWDKTLEGSCLDLRKINLGAVVVILLLDIAILILPQRVIWGLQMNRARKVGVSAVFTIGVFIRLTWVHRATIASAFLFNAILQWSRSDDMTYHFSAVALWAIAEMTGGILVFCAPVVPRFIHDLALPQRFSDFRVSVSSIMNGILRSQHGKNQRQNPSISFTSHEHPEVGEVGDIGLEALSSPRPTDRQYGIVVGTDTTDSV